MENLFNNDWEFTKQPIGCDIGNIAASSIKWQKIDIPHDWVIYDTDSFHESCEGWYRKHFWVKPEDCAAEEYEWKTRRYLLRFEGVYMDSTIYINGIKAGEWKYGYSTFEIDITEALKAGDNEILVRVVLQVPNSRWYTGGGIYRNVWLRIVPNVYLASDGVYISTEKLDDSWNVRIESEIIKEHTLTECNEGIENNEGIEYNEGMECNEGIECNEGMELQVNSKTIGVYTIRHTIIDRDGKIVLQTEGKDKVQLLSIASPHLWEINDPYLYILKTELLKDGYVTDDVRNRFGFRAIRYDTESGFYLNEQHVKLHGVCQHHDLGALGAAVNRMAIKRQLTLLKEMGVNAIRTAHNMCAVELLELADEMGILINSEAFDMWERPKNTYDYARFFEEWSDRDVASWIRRDRNHPCVIMWSIGNEIYDTHTDEHGQAITRRLMDLVYQHDPCRNARVTIGSNYMPWENAQKCADIVKLAGYNYAEKYYEKHHNEHKDWMIYGSETGSVVQSRGIYHFPLGTGILSDDDEQCSSLGNSITSWGARSTEQCIIDDRDSEFSAGMFIWSGFDYIGEPTPYHTKNSYFGQLDTAGFKKDSFYQYQAEWTDYRNAPMVHLYPYWDFNEGQMIDICICSNAPKVELFFNGRSLGTFEINHEIGHKLFGDWRIPYRKGELKAVAYDLEGNIIAEDMKRSYTDAKKIVLKPDKMGLMADGRDLIFVEISMEDCNGNPVYNANNRVNVKVSGAGRLIGLDNGDSTDYDSYKGTSRRLFSGKLLAIISAKTDPGDISLEVTSPGLPGAQMMFQSKECEVPSGISALEANTDRSEITEIPIRKLEMISPQGTQLNEKLCEVKVEVIEHPVNATYHDITWRVTNDSGVDSNIVKLIPDGHKATIQALGDGNFYLRASTNNGAGKPRLISALDFSITGLGTAFYNPYEFISGSLFSSKSGEITNGNERGVATSRDGESIVIYDKLDFGADGSDEITIPIFELGSVPTQIEIWEGVPHTVNSELLADVIYHKKSIWNTYQEETYRLKKRLKGITSIAFLLRSKVHIKGFLFEKFEKAYEQLSVLSYSALYGDSYTIGEDSITGIGNNVTITFDDMDFGQKGISKLLICGRSLIEKNTIHVRFSGSNDEIKQLAEFMYSPEYMVCEYPMDNVVGKQSVSFLFLPGCKFDFKWFRFE